MTKTSLRKSEKGQALLETLLLAALFLGATQFAFKQLREREFFQQAFGSPWVKLQNLIHYGVPLENEKKARALHPANGERHLTKTE
jgi:hypothetical protein